MYRLAVHILAVTFCLCVAERRAERIPWRENKNRQCHIVRRTEALKI
jgi:hypothetical protein